MQNVPMPPTAPFIAPPPAPSPPKISSKTEKILPKPQKGRGNMLDEIRKFRKGGLKKRETKESGNPYKIENGKFVKNKKGPAKGSMMD
jgi:hypothetical protein